ncbi:hypothetical protein PHYBOEH_001964 [Phytophthora boehmeriae]|uniref:Uncharacterized protein n=1 Tax=Phytophthora boehmeriae TaxID=109152 RepID=A0A8T1WTV5_9STRA|nr:hypothetical protein PHYBOEH_001964 [Phytophthora boehmeriae]
MQTNSPKSDHKNEVGSRHPSNRTPLSPSSSFFIIQEPSNSVISPTGGSKSPPKLRRSGDESASKSSHKDRASSSSGKKKKLRFKSPTSAPTSPLAQSLSVKEDLKPGTPLPLRSTSAELTGDHNSVEAAVDGDTAANTAASAQKRPADLSILNRCGSAPQLPLYSPTSASVYSSSKKRALQSSTNGASPHLVALQRSRLTPLPAKPPSVDVKQDPSLDNLDERNTPQHSQAKNEDQEAMRLCPKDPLLREKVLQDAYTIASLKQRLVILEREASTSTKARHAAEKQIEQLTRDNSRLYAEKTHHEARVGEMDRVVLRQRHEFDKLAARYAAVYASLQKLVDQQQHGGDNSALQTALQALARENQDFLRKLRVLEARHIEDKTLASNQEKKIKRLRAEMEALRHMSDANNRGEDFDESSDVTQAPAVSRLAKPKNSEVKNETRVFG